MRNILWDASQSPKPLHPTNKNPTHKRQDIKVRITFLPKLK